MTRHKIRIGRTKGFWVSNNTLGTDALNALAAIPGLTDMEVEHETEDEVEISYVWTGTEKFLTMNEHLEGRGLHWLDQ
ncbi:MAG: hypothetical protein EVA59_07775 [Limnobacter sp.]|jgi:hypothetical protein|uniref:hypothetical protein n=1 Tax=Limnobacter sp. TaxID=2003368 RepID=UPI00122814F5|nr:hypothetical protein [Limnobacter sp.]MDZ4050338.1 hypothetical protein [Limnobacter sp.]RZO92871.1 MAG: hypothetical protein EVA59_07775 [Limnobacter sp.]